jgi:hypothetical protein
MQLPKPANIIFHNFPQTHRLAAEKMWEKKKKRKGKTLEFTISVT